MNTTIAPTAELDAKVLAYLNDTGLRFPRLATGLTLDELAAYTHAAEAAGRIIAIPGDSYRWELAPVVFAVEESDAPGVQYKHVHRAGCRDLRDPEAVTSLPRLGSLLLALNGYAVADTEDELAGMLAPCAKALLA